MVPWPGRVGAAATRHRGATADAHTASVGSRTAAGAELSTGTSVMAIGGWEGSHPSVTLAQFRADVASGRLTSVVAAGLPLAINWWRVPDGSA